ncbi:hypothetical protein K501DRAFT_190384 [Backusella circina FSU 941]|nr:hypothetical protein K501DRAFT_190384 [Backusella circina FSU 941]
MALVLALIVLVDASENTHNGAGHRISRAKRALDKRSGSYSGDATWFTPSINGGSMGACGDYEADDAAIVALNAPQYGSLSSKSSWCGKKIKITHNGKSVTATINDACPECGYGSLDLTPTLFSQLGSQDTGVLDITWSVI